MNRMLVGRRAEDAAVGFLKRRGFRIIERNFFCRYGEIDIVAKSGSDLVVVEVRSATSPSFVDPLESIGSAKMGRLRKVAQAWLRAREISDYNLRFDVVAVVFERKTGKTQIRHIKGAF